MLPRLFLLLWACSTMLSAIAADSPVMRIRCERDAGASTNIQHGSCVAIRDAALSLGPRSILTAAHVVDRDGHIKIESREGHWTTAHITKLDAQRDIALLTADEDLPHSAPLAAPGAYTVSGSKEGTSIKAGAAIPTSLTAHVSDFGSGMSGGALFNAAGELAGITSAGIAGAKGVMRPDVGVFVMIDEIRAFLKGP